MKKKINIRTTLYLAGGIVIGLVAGWLIFPGGSASNENSEAHDHSTMDSVTEWTCSMHPQIRQSEPGNCPICGMELIPVDQLGSSPVVLEMTEEAIKLAKIETTPVKLSSPEKQVFLQGKVRADERKISLITSRFPGRIERLYVDFTGMEVRKGQRLTSIYSPELVTAQQELFEAIKYKGTNDLIYQAARNKLKLWNITETQIDSIEQGGKVQTVLDVLSPLSGVVIQRHATLGQYVKEGTPLFEIVDLSRVWVMFDAYESDLPWLKVGNKVEYTIASIPGKKFDARVTFIDPVVNPATRSVSVRVETHNPGKLLKPDMFANGTIHASLPIREPQLIIPKPAVLWTGTRAVVYVKVDNVHKPSFLFREIELGPDLGTHFIVESGLEENEVIVSNGAFKIDAAAQLAGKNSMMNESETGLYKGKIHVPDAFRQQLTLLFNSYTGLKNALVSSDPQVAKTAAEAGLKQLGGVEMHLLDKNGHDTWMKLHDPMKESLEAISKSEDLVAQRKSFIPLSDAMSNAIEIFGIHGVKVYKDYCPMADGNNGAYWLSEVEEIQNPYFGEKMLKCGEVRQVYDGKPKSNENKTMQGHQH